MTGDDVKKVLRNARRRYVLYCLDTSDGAVTLEELVKQIAAWENDVPVEETATEQRKSVYSSLHQTHLPKLEKSGSSATIPTKRPSRRRN